MVVKHGLFYRCNVNRLKTLHQRDFCSILKIKWNDFINNEDVLARAKVEDIEVKLTCFRLIWLGHTSRINENMPDKALLCGERASGSCNVGFHFSDIKTLVRVH